MKRVPKSVRIGCHDYEIAMAKKVVADDGQKCNGLVSDDRVKIWLDRYQKVTKKREHLTHEILHGMFYGFPFDDDEIEEKIVLFLAPKLVEVLQDNPALVEYLVTR